MELCVGVGHWHALVGAAPTLALGICAGRYVVTLARPARVATAMVTVHANRMVVVGVGDGVVCDVVGCPISAPLSITLAKCGGCAVRNYITPCRLCGEWGSVAGGGVVCHASQHRNP